MQGSELQQEVAVEGAANCVYMYTPNPNDTEEDAQIPGEGKNHIAYYHSFLLATRPPQKSYNGMITPF